MRQHKSSRHFKGLIWSRKCLPPDIPGRISRRRLRLFTAIGETTRIRSKSTEKRKSPTPPFAYLAAGSPTTPPTLSAKSQFHSPALSNATQSKRNGGWYFTNPPTPNGRSRWGFKTSGAVHQVGRCRPWKLKECHRIIWKITQSDIILRIMFVLLCFSPWSKPNKSPCWIQKFTWLQHFGGLVKVSPALLWDFEESPRFIPSLTKRSHAALEVFRNKT